MGSLGGVTRLQRATNPLLLRSQAQGASTSTVTIKLGAIVVNYLADPHGCGDLAAAL